MKLTKSQIARVKEHFGADPVPEDSPAEELLKEHFGDHTFYVDEIGLHVFETEASPETTEGCRVLPVRVASWTNEAKDALAPHDPVVGENAVVVDIED